MRLRHVRITGFKTFVERTEFAIDAGIVAVVGPNGCGKSNLVDAILWGLGEGNARSLRAASHQDVIFGGSSRRKPVNRAEVVLTFDNEDRGLPMDAPEVSVTRRLERDGGSEYAINGRVCRLRDVHELLADSGLGRSGYAIVGQKEIDAALSASAADRRDWIDEAAGIQRYRARRAETRKRLEVSRERWVRLEEDRARLAAAGPELEREAGRARRHLELREALGAVERGLLRWEIAAARRESAEADAREREAHRIVAEDLAALERLSLDLATLSDALRGDERARFDAAAEHENLLVARERAAATIALTEERLAALARDADRTAEDEVRDRERSRLADEEALIAQEDSESARVAAEGSAAELAAVKKTLTETERRFGDLDRRLTQARKHAERVQRAAIEAEVHAARRAEIARERAEVALRVAETETAATEAETAEAEARAVRDEARRAALVAAERVQAARDAAARAGRALEAAQDELRRAEALAGRLREAMEAFETLPAGARAVVAAARSGHLSATYEPVASLVEAEPDVALAIETALGGAAHDLVVERDADAKAAIELLKRARAGRATFQPLDLVRGYSPGPEIERAARLPGVLGRAADLVAFPTRVERVVESLLGRVLVAESLDVALRHARTSGWSRIVTLEGEVVHAGGAVSGGTQATRSVGLVQRRAELAAAEAALREADGRVGPAARLVRETADALPRLCAEEESSRKAAAEAESDHRDAANWAGELRAEAVAARRDADRLAREADRLTAATDPETGAPVDLDALGAERDEAAVALADARARLAALGPLTAADAERAALAATRAKATAARAAAARAEIEDRRARLLGTAPREEALRLTLTETHASLSDLDARRETAARLLADLDARIAERREKIEDLSRRSRTREAEMARQEATLREAAHARSRADARRASAVERLFEEYGEPEPPAHDAPPEPEPDAASQAQRLRREIRHLGDVHLGAIEAHARWTEEHAEATARAEDVAGAIEEIERSLAEMDRITAERFDATFDRVAAEFSDLVTDLFGGGVGRLERVPADDPGDVGVSLDVALPGKRRQALALLSGGERSLCATAFLFALLRVKPAPLVVLDEVDAPLDGGNVDRFARMVRAHADRIQFIVVTHNPATVESADVWLGVTMQEPGVSSLVPVRAPE